MKKVFLRLMAVSGMVLMAACAKQEPVQQEPTTPGTGDDDEEEVTADAPSLAWAANPEFAVVDINDELDAAISVTAPGGISKLVLDVKSDVLAKALANLGLPKTYLDLVGDEDVTAVLGD